MGKKVLLVGNGAREHAISEALKKSPDNISLIVYGKALNPGIREYASRYEIGALNDFDKIKKLVEEEHPNFAVIGPEDPLEKGVVDFLESLGVPSASPKARVAQLETSKSFARDLLKKYNIPGNPDYRVFTSLEGGNGQSSIHGQSGMREYMEELKGECVVKADGLMGGKGVKVMGAHLKDIDEAFDYAHECLQKFGKVVIEEKLIGQEFSLMSFTDGKTVKSMPPVQDHKRAFNGDKGPNTGGMGSYSCRDHLLPFLTSEEAAEAHKINEFTVNAIHRETGEYYKGVIYGGFIVTARGVRLIEYNARFGDPEIMNVLPLLKTDYVAICEHIIKGELDRIDVKFENLSTVCKYLVPNGYPDNPVSGEKIEIDLAAVNQALKAVSDGHARVRLYYSSVDQRKDGLYLSSSRAIAIAGIATLLSDAEKIAQGALKSVVGPVFFRGDIGTQELIDQRVEMMKTLRA